MQARSNSLQREHGLLIRYSRDEMLYFVTYKYLKDRFVAFALNHAEIVEDDDVQESSGENAYFVQGTLGAVAPLARAWQNHILALPLPGDTEADYRVQVPAQDAWFIDESLRLYLHAKPGDVTRDSLLTTAQCTAPSHYARGCALPEG